MSLGAWLSLAVGVGALVFAYLAWRVSKTQLQLAREQAQLRPNLVVSLRDVAWHFRPPNPAAPHEQAAIVFEITNDGRTAAHGVRCEVVLDGGKLGAPHHTIGEVRDFEAPYMGPTQTLVHSVNASVLEYGTTEVRYICTCDEVGATEGSLDVEISRQDH